jgi:hypothetical protein
MLILHDHPTRLDTGLAGAGEPLAATEVAALQGIDLAAARAELEPLGDDGLWSLSVGALVGVSTSERGASL